MLQGKLEVDVAIIGGGLTGLSAARRLAKLGKKVAVLEASRVGFGASGRNGGQIGTGQRLDQISLEKLVGKDHAKDLFDIGNRAAKHAKTMAGANFQAGVAHACFNAKEFAHETKYKAHLEDHYGYEGLEAMDRDAFQSHVKSPRYFGGVVDWNAGHCDPLALTLELAKEAESAGATIYENSRVIGLEPLRTKNGEVRAQHVIMATNGYHNDIETHIAKYVMPINNFIVATEPLGAMANALIPKRFAVADTKFVVNYFRISDDQRLVFGGGESYGYRFPKNLAEKAHKPMLEIFPQLKGAKIEYAWGGTLGITMNRMPFVSRIQNTWISGGYSGHGLAMSMECGDIIARAIHGDDRDFQIMNTIPHQKFPGGVHMRQPLLVAAMLWFQMRDLIGL